jgi:hypothetical protein
MAKVIPLERAVKLFFITLVALLAMLGGSELSDRLISNHAASVSARWFGVTVAVLAVVPWVIMMVWAVGVGDEFIRQVALAGTAVAFVGNFLVKVGIAAARDAALVSATFDLPPLQLALGLWVGGVALAAIYYRFRP